MIIIRHIMKFFFVHRSSFVIFYNPFRVFNSNIIIGIFINFFISKCIIKIISISINHHTFQMCANVFVYEKLRVCGRGFSEGKSEASKQATTFMLAKTSNFLYTVLATGFLFPFICSFFIMLNYTFN